MKYKIKRLKGSFILLKDDELLFEVLYHKWSVSKADFYIDETFVSLKPQNIWMRKLDILKNNVDVGDIIFNWKGHFIIQVEDETYKMNDFLIKPVGFWKRQYEVYNSIDKPLFKILPKFSWKSFGHDFEIEIDHFSFKESEIKLMEELMVYAVFGIIIKLTQASGAA
jgi:hypothetical protein